MSANLRVLIKKLQVIKAMKERELEQKIEEEKKKRKIIEQDSLG